jgi:hypothetical protein
MRRVLAVLILVVVAVPAFREVMQACGDKFLIVGRGIRFQRAYASVYPGHLVVYAPKSLGANAALRDPGLPKLLRQAGHTVSIIEDGSLLEQAVRSSSTDIVLVDLVDAQRVDNVAAAAPARPNIVAVRPNQKSAELDQLQQQFTCKLKSSDNAVKWLDTIEDVMKARTATRRAPKS